MRAVNLIPAEARRGGSARGMAVVPTYVVLGTLALGVVLAALYVLAGNNISQSQSQLTSLDAQVAQAQSQAKTLVKYQQFAKLEQARIQTVKQIASTRFDWYGALSDLSKVIPANTSLQSLYASVSPGSSSGAASGGGGGSSTALRSDISAPAFELTGCTKTQDDVARLMSRLRLINGVTRVTLGDSQKQGGAQGGASVSSSSSGQPAGCGSKAPSFDLVVFFTPLPGASTTSTGAPGATTAAGGKAPASTPAGAASTASPAASTTTTPGATTPAASASTPVSTGGGG